MRWFVDWQAGRAGNSIFEHVCQKKAVDLLIGRPAELALDSASENLCWFVDWQAGRAGNSIFEHVCQKKAVDLLIGRPAELALAIVYVREIVLICWLAGQQSWQFDFRTCMPEKSCWFFDRQTGRAGTSIVYQRNCVDLLIGRPAELAIRFLHMYVRKKPLICWSADRQSYYWH